MDIENKAREILMKKSNNILEDFVCGRWDEDEGFDMFKTSKRWRPQQKASASEKENVKTKDEGFWSGRRFSTVRQRCYKMQNYFGLRVNFRRILQMSYAQNGCCCRLRSFVKCNCCGEKENQCGCDFASKEDDSAIDKPWRDLWNEAIKQTRLLWKVYCQWLECSCSSKDLDGKKGHIMVG